MERFHKERDDPIKGSLVIQPLSAISDMLFHLRALRALAKQSPSGKIVLLARKSSKVDQYLSHEPWLEDILWLDEKRHFGPLGGVSLGKDLAPFAFQDVWILHHSPRYYIAASFAGIPKRFGYGFGWLKDFLTSPHHLGKKEKGLHALVKYERLFKAMQIPLKEEDQYLTPASSLVEEMMDYFKDHPRPWVGIGYGAKNPLRIWPREKFIDLIEALTQKGMGTFFLFGSPDELPLGEGILAGLSLESKKRCVHAPFSLRDSCALLSRLNLFVGNDGGLLALAGAFSIPSYGLFAALGPRQFSLDIFTTSLKNERERTTSKIEEISVEDVLRVCSFS